MRGRGLVAVGAAALILVAGCTTGGKSDGPPERRDGATTLRIVAGSEQEKVLATIVRPWCESKGYRCETTLKGSVDQARLLSAGDKAFDAYWFASSVFLQVGDKSNALQDVKPMFLTPVVYAGWRGEMQRLGLAGRTDVSISDILTAVESGKTRVWATNPTQSNSGATVLFGFLNHFAGNGPGKTLTREQLDLPAVDTGISRFIKAMDQTPPSTGTLMNECVARPDDCKTLFTYEDLVIEKNQELVKAGREPLVVAYPRGSLAISDAPLGFLPHHDDSDAGKRRILTELQDYLLTSPEAQAKLLGLGRRPASSIGLTLDKPDLAVFNPDWGIQATVNEQGIQFPAAPVIEAALNRYQTHYRRPVAAHYCLDGSGSMGDNDGWTGVEAAARQIFDADQAAANFLQTHPEDTTTVTVFSRGITAGPWTVNGNDATALHGLTEKINEYAPGGGTNMYECLNRAADELSRSPSGDRKRLLVLMTDGLSERNGREAALAALKSAKVPVVAIAFGSDADPSQLKEVANATGGAFFEQDDLVAALRQAAGYK
ncbi:vWA domain-containing protein [Micromonospora sp. WMMD812]|uniref:vWA domain-containing protein n=1 Tax=Micromonospora sp. WMMD812 TaxID=3015152 RepID=UPI00248C50AF|nr:vWA domain-containing protein [Micromonospora sp. WMMD812]WBB70782.1 VWA domain-containing protein [Micromonospora sp. WMMD812]